VDQNNFAEKAQRKFECFEAMESKEEVVKLTLGLW
jgi:hypothetical protein